jgi:nuclear RNA export factor
MDVAVKGRSKIGKTPPTGPAASRRDPAGTRGKNGILSGNAQRAILRSAASGDVSMKEGRAPRGGGIVDLKVENYQKSKAANGADGGITTLKHWLERKAGMRLGRRDVKIKKSQLDGDTLVISVPSVDARAYERMDGYDWAGAKISIKRADGTSSEANKPSSAAEETKAMLRGVLERRWNPDAKLLDLSALGVDPELQANNMFDQKSTTSKFFPALMRVLELSFNNNQERDEAIQSVSLANNDLVDLKLVSTLSETLPNLLNLDLSNNKLENLDAMAIWRRRFRKLQHLVVSGNPLEQNDPTAAAELVKWYENLRMLNNVQVRTEEDIKNKNNITNIPFPIRSPLFQDEGGIAETFIRTFFAGYDTDRTALAQMYYDDNSEFSFALNTAAPRDPAGTEKTEKQEWDRYIKGSRNLKKISQLPARQNRLFRGAKAVSDAFAELPVTKHPDLATESSKWLIEAHIQPGLPDPLNNSPAGVDGFFISIHGEFKETETGKRRSADHAFYIGPGGSTGVRIISHTMTIRAYGGSQAFQPVPNTPPLPAVEAATSDGVPQLPAGISVELAEQMVNELTKQTGMTLQYSSDCLTQTGWNFDGALAAFQSVKANLPPAAFVNGVPVA